MSLGSFVKWLYPGMHIKRWLVLLLFGITFVSLGIAYVITHTYRTQPFPEYVFYLTLQFVDRPLRGVLFVLVGLSVSVIAVIQLNRSLLSPFRGGRNDNLVDIIFQHRYLQRGPKVVVIGGGHGLSTLLRGMKEYTRNLTAIVTVGDDGGSSGRLRQDFGVLPPGDLRMCLVALADAEPLMTKLFQYRFDRGSGLEGHSFGNLFLVAMNAITGNFERALRESSRVLAVRGQILPSTLQDITVCAEYDDLTTAEGESLIPESGKRVKRLFLQPSNPPAYGEAVKAILDADLVVIGPGSLYTSVMPNLLIEEITHAIRVSDAVKVYVCNVATQRGETDNFQVHHHVEVIERHCGAQLFQYVLINDNLTAAQAAGSTVVPVNLNGFIEHSDVRPVVADVVDEQEPRQHDPQKLAHSLMKLYYDRGQSRVNGSSHDLEAKVGAHTSS
ncbi:MAG TPA: gluconeogenesis factor YvcK family protein [Chloroflexota bacterium]|nr:gluconeogenesis factor YvcK family protein [Chloroflexota bacterium]